MKCVCGNDRYFAHQVCHHDVIVSASGEYTEDRIIYYSGKPFGPYTCTKCGVSGADGDAGKYKKRAINAVIFWIIAESVWIIKDLVLYYYAM